MSILNFYDKKRIIITSSKTFLKNVLKNDISRCAKKARRSFKKGYLTMPEEGNVLFVNGIPLAVIECKRPDLKGQIKEAISQHTHNQGHGYIPQLFTFCQLLISVSQNQAKYATANTPAKFWSIWRTELLNAEKNAATVSEAPAGHGVSGFPKPVATKRSLQDVANQPLTAAMWKKFEPVRHGARCNGKSDISTLR